MRSYREGRNKAKQKKKSCANKSIKKSERFFALCAFVVLFFLALFLAFLRDWYL
jgi:hypothetical protein